MKRKLFFLSDTHLGFRYVNDFHYPMALHQFFHHVEKEGGELILNGDILELLQTDLLHIYFAHKPILDHLFHLANRTKVSYVIGNHDALVSAFYKPGHPQESRLFGSNIFILPSFEDTKMGVWAEHGHMYDAFNRKSVSCPVDDISAGDRIASAVGWMERYISPDMDTALEKMYSDSLGVLKKIQKGVSGLFSVITPDQPEYEGDLTEYAKAAEKILEKDAYSVCIFGHTHTPGIQAFDKGYYLNTGSWVHHESPPTYVCVTEEEVLLGNAQTFEVIEQRKR